MRISTSTRTGTRRNAAFEKRNSTEHGHFSYNNTNYDLLGYILKHVTEDAKKFIQEHIFEPLSMDADFMEDVAPSSTALPFWSEGHYGMLESQGRINGNANVVSTLESYGRFLRGYSSILSERAVKVFHSLYFFTQRSGELYFSAGGSGDFAVDEAKYRSLTKSLAITRVRDGTTLILSQNYMGPKAPLIFQTYSFWKDPNYYEQRDSLNFERTLVGKCVNLLFPGLVRGSEGDSWWGGRMSSTIIRTDD